MLENFLLFWAQLLTVSKKKRGDTVICKLSRLNTNTGLPLAAVCGKEGGGVWGWRGRGGGGGNTLRPHLSILICTSNKISRCGCLQGGSVFREDYAVILRIIKIKMSMSPSHCVPQNE